jgi:hypothetical protein
MRRVFSYGIWCAIVVAAMARPTVARAQSAASLANLPENRGKVIGSPCQPSDGYQPDWSKINAKAAQAAKTSTRPINVMDYVGADTPQPIATDRLPPGTVYCLPTIENPSSYLTSNCHVDGDCPKSAVCDGQMCRAACSMDSDCPPPTVCGPAPGTPRWCRRMVEHIDHDVPAANESGAPAQAPRKHTRHHRKSPSQGHKPS